MGQRIVRISVIASCVLIGGLLAGCEPPGDLVVTKTADTNDGHCDSDCSLREAVQAANARAGRDTVRLSSSHYVLTRRGTNEDGGATGDLDVHGDIVFDGGGAVVDGNHLDRVLDVRAGRAELYDLQIRNGTENDQEGGGVRNLGTLVLDHAQVVLSSSGFSGGGIRNLGVLDATDSRVSLNNSGGGGGGIASGGTAGSSLGLVRTTVASNTNTEEGAGILATGVVRIEQSHITGNNGGPGSGMGLFNGGDAVVRNSVISANGALEEICGGGVANTGTLEVRSSTISNNKAEGGGGIYNQGALTVVGGKIQSNRAGHGGGGILNASLAPGRDGSVLVDGAVITGNVAESAQPSDLECGAGGQVSGGGGLFDPPGLAFGLHNTTVANDTDVAGASPDCSGTFHDRGGNTIGDRKGCVLVP